MTLRSLGGFVSIIDDRFFSSGHTSIEAKIAVATSEDRASTEATLSALAVTPLVDAMICADDGLPIKPEPDMVLHLCQ